MPGRKGQNRARVSKEKTGEEWVKGPKIGGTGFGSRVEAKPVFRPPGTVLVKPTYKTEQKAASSTTITATATTTSLNTVKTLAPTTGDAIPASKRFRLPTSRPNVEDSKPARPPILIPKEGFERSLDISQLNTMNKVSSNEGEEGGEENVKKKKKKKAKDGNGDSNVTNGSSSSGSVEVSGEVRKRSRSPPPQKKVKAVDPRIGLIKKRKRKKDVAEDGEAAGGEEEEQDPVKRALRVQLKRIAKLAAIVTHKDPEVRQKVTGSFDRLIADFPMAEPIVQKWRELDNAKNRKLVVRCLQGLKSSIMRQLRELKVQKSTESIRSSEIAQESTDNVVTESTTPKKKKKKLKPASNVSHPPPTSIEPQQTLSEEPQFILNFDIPVSSDST